MANPGLLILSLTAAAAISARHIVKYSGTDGAVATADDPTDLLIGVSEKLDADLGDKADVIMDGSAECVAGAAIVHGAPVTADAQGRAVTAGEGENAIGFALSAAAAAGDFIDVKVTRFTVPNAAA
jgi:hypothetical protein